MEGTHTFKPVTLYFGPSIFICLFVHLLKNNCTLNHLYSSLLVTLNFLLTFYENTFLITLPPNDWILTTAHGMIFLKSLENSNLIFLFTCVVIFKKLTLNRSINSWMYNLSFAPLSSYLLTIFYLCLLTTHTLLSSLWIYKLLCYSGNLRQLFCFLECSVSSTPLAILSLNSLFKGHFLGEASSIRWLTHTHFFLFTHKNIFLWREFILKIQFFFPLACDVKSGISQIFYISSNQYDQ